MKKVICLTLVFIYVFLLFIPTKDVLAEYEAIDISAQGYCVMDADTKEVLLEKNKDTRYAPASITKIMTALVTSEQVQNLDETITFPKEAIDSIDIMSSTLDPVAKVGETFTIRDLLYGMMMKSGNECASTLGIYTAGSIEAFTSLMNEKAVSLGANNTHFSNAHGLDSTDHYTTPYDMALIFQEALKNETVREVMSTKEYTIPATNLSSARSLKMGHQMVRGDFPVDGVYAGKTGYTVKAKWTLATAVNRNGRNLIVVTMKSDEGKIYTDTATLLEYVFGILQNGTALPGPAVYDVKVSEMDRSGFTVSCHVSPSVTSVKVPVWTNANGQDDLKWGEAKIEGDRAIYRVFINNHNNEYGVYTVIMYGYSSDGRENASTINVLMSGETQNTGMYPYNGGNYYIKPNGSMGIGWVETSENSYYMGDDGQMRTGLTTVGNITYYLKPDGSAENGWVEWEGIRYYMQKSGDMAKGLMKIDERYYYFDAEGRLRDGLLLPGSLDGYKNRLIGH